MSTNGQTYEEDGVETEIGSLALLSGTDALGAVDRAAIDVQVSTAKQYPRSVDRSLKEAMTLATLDEETAASMFYVLPRSGKKIEGPSSRLAEVMAYSWGNLRVDADIVAEDKTHVTAMGTCFDLEKNVAVRVRVKRRITDKRGVRYNEDMIGVTSNAAISIALRNAVFKVIPVALVNRIYGEARKASVGKGGTMAQRRQGALEWFTKVGVTEQQVFDVLEVRGIDDIGMDELIALRGIKTAIKDGETTVEQAFRRVDSSEGSADLNEALGGSAPEKKDAEPKKASEAQLKGLSDLIEKAREAGAADIEMESLVSDALEAGAAEGVKNATKVVSTALAKHASKEG